jgi:hypothetical protein
MLETWEAAYEYRAGRRAKLQDVEVARLLGWLDAHKKGAVGAI